MAEPSFLPPNETALFDEISKLAADIWEKSRKIEGSNRDPLMMSVFLFKRLWSHHCGYAVLYNSQLLLEGDIILRAGIESAICIAANARLGQQFHTLMQQDAASTLQGQIKLHRAANAVDMVRLAEAALRDVLAALPEGTKAARLDWEDLARKGGVPQLYGFHRNLSGTSSHVTGLSILRGVGGDGAFSLQTELYEITRRMRPMMMAAATLHGSAIQAGMIEDNELAQRALSLVARLNEASLQWAS